MLILKEKRQGANERGKRNDKIGKSDLEQKRHGGNFTTEWYNRLALPGGLPASLWRAASGIVNNSTLPGGEMVSRVVLAHVFGVRVPARQPGSV